MIRYTKFVIILMGGLTLFSCKGKEDDEPDKIIEPEETAFDLSENGMANCYIVQESGLYKFKADNQFNLGDGLPVPPEISPVSARLIWQTEKNSIQNVELKIEEDTPYVVFNVSKAEGNALIGVANANGDIEWSWHIWMPKEEITGIKADNGYEIMNMNLGAITNEAGNAESYGMLYQWGRKDPFPASATLTGNTSTLSAPMYDGENNQIRLANSSWTDLENNTLAYSISHPTVVLSNYAQYSLSRDWLHAALSDDSLWGNPNGEEKDDANNIINKGHKTCYDPSPLGWRVPPSDAFREFTSTGNFSMWPEEFNIADINGDGIKNTEDFNYGWNFFVNEKSTSYFPAASRFDGSYAMLMGSMSGLWGNYWSNTPYSQFGGGAISALAFQVKDMNGQDFISVSPSAGASRADAYSVRCVRDE